LLQQQISNLSKTKSPQTSGADAPQPSQAPAKRKGPKSTKTQPERQKTTPSSPPHPVSLIQIVSSPSPSEPQTQEVPSPPRSVPQPQEAPTDVSEQIANLVDLGTSSVAPPEQTITIPPQGKVLITELLPMNLSIS